MKSRKRIWIAVLCLLSATVVAISLRAHIAAVEAATEPVHSSRTLATGAVAHFTDASLRASAIRNAVLLDDSATPTRVDGNLQSNRRLFPKVEEFALTPPAKKALGTIFSVRFAGDGAENLPSQLPTTLGNQHVIIRRSGDDPNVFLATVNFDWRTFAAEQQERKEAASAGKMVAIFDGRKFLRKEPMQFVDPAEIEGALQSHQTLHIVPQQLIGGAATVIPDHELMITAIPVVEDTNRTFDQCVPSAVGNGNANGAWTFNTLMQAIACSSGAGNCTQQAAENMLLGMLTAWQSNQTINSFQVSSRANIGTLGGTSGLLSNWPIDPNNICSGANGAALPCPSLPKAPVHLNAIVNRVDLGQNDPPFPSAGELRFVFGVTAGTTFNQQPQPCSNNGNQLFNIILEYNVPSTFTGTSWAGVWNNLEENGTFDATYRNELQSTITDQVVKAGDCTNAGGAAVSCISQVRTNEIELGNNGLWEQRQFQLTSDSLGRPALKEGTVFMTPDSSFNFGAPKCGTSGVHACNNNGILVNYINTNQAEILQSGGALPIVPNNWPPATPLPFLGGSALNGLGAGSGNAFWVDQTQTTSENARIDFSVNTCNGCHGSEAHTLFQQVVNRSAGTGTDAPSNLANFLLGCTNGTDSCAVGGAGQCTLNAPCQESVPDPNPNAPPTQSPTLFGDILRRQTYMEGLLNNDPGAGGILFSLLAQPVGVH